MKIDRVVAGLPVDMDQRPHPEIVRRANTNVMTITLAVFFGPYEQSSRDLEVFCKQSRGKQATHRLKHRNVKLSINLDAHQGCIGETIN